MADAEEIWIAEDFWRYPGVAALLESYPAEPRTAGFRGIERPRTVGRISGRGARARAGPGGVATGVPLG